MTAIAVVHLVWAPLGSGALERFLASYRAHAAGLEHRLVLLFKDFASREAAAEVAQAAAGVEHEALHYPATTLDLPAYLWAAERLDAEALCLLNSESVLLGSGWLAALHAALADAGGGAVGATGSYETPFSRLPLRRRRWPAFPNPHLRTNAFMTSRELLRALDWPPVRDKRRAWELESGKRGLTRAVWSRGGRVLVVGRDGETFPPERWPFSATFRAGDQAKLLVADNRTRQWADADGPTRSDLARRAWGPDPERSAALVAQAGRGAPIRGSGA